MSDAARRFLVEPETDLLSRRAVTDDIPGPTMIEVRRAVLAGHELRIHYAATGRPPGWRTVDPIGLVTVRDRVYLPATRAGADRTHRLSRVPAAEELPEAAERPSRVDLDRIWRERSAWFLGGDHITVQVRVEPARREELLDTAPAVRAEEPAPDGRLQLTFQDSRHAEWALWQLGTDAEAEGPTLSCGGTRPPGRPLSGRPGAAPAFREGAGRRSHRRTPV